MTPRFTGRPKAVLLSILAVSAALRLWIAFRGGQNYWPDESRFEFSLRAAADLRQGKAEAAFVEIFAHVDHVLFKVMGLAPALLQSFGAPAWSAAAFFGFFSVAGIYVLARISLVAGGDPWEGVLAAAVAACSSSLLYFSRHYFPYDACLCLSLLGLYVGLAAPTPRGSFLAGLCVSLGFLTYLGYWLFCGVCLILITLYRAAGVRSFLLRCAAALLGFGLPLLAVFAAARAAGTSLPAQFSSLSQSVTLGDFAQGWTYVWDYLWQAEKGIVALWVACAAAGCALAIAGRRRHILWWALAVVLMYVTLGEMSAGMHRFVIAGRTARSIVPFLVLMAAGVLAEIGRAGRPGRCAQCILLAWMVLQAGANFRPIVTQYFPPEFRAAALSRSMAVPAGERGRLRILNAFFFHQAVFAEVKAKHHTLWSEPHPLQYRPYQYEGYRSDQRALFDSHDITMRLVYMDEVNQQFTRMPDPALEGYFGPIRIRLILPPKRGIYCEPLVVTGRSENGDFLYLSCEPTLHTVEVGLDHWGSGGPSSGAITADYKVPHVFDISMGSLMPPADSGVYRAHPEWLPLTHRIIVKMDGRTVLNADRFFFPSDPSEATIGANLIGGSTTNPNISAVISAVEPLDAGSFIRDFRRSF
jgi:hypothetical protein